MKLYEYMGKELFNSYGLPVPEGTVIKSAAEAKQGFAAIGSPAVVKAQVLSGKRGKAGGIKFVDTPEEAEHAAAELLHMSIQGLAVDQLLMEEKLKIDQEYYLAVTIDARAGKPVVIASAAGGMDIEEVPEDRIVKKHVDINLGIQPYHAREISYRLGLKAEFFPEFARILTGIFLIFREKDAELVEINPLILSGDHFVLGDAKITIDDSALAKHPELPRVEEKTENEKLANALGLAYVELDGDIAIMANGAGITMGTIDAIQYHGGRAANFLDAGGGSNKEATAKALEILLISKPKAIFINIFGGITRCDDVAGAFAQVKAEKGIEVPVVIRLVGTNQEEGLRILRECGIEAYKSMNEAAMKVVELAKLA
ncbi:ADP-forming succinate--CoA ligase subunit beta [Paradesulfitobacterium ferrireducens]|uniref:ADP-forming succinate--CoA ligase subunit beta n=1 Tax=Paradesulfitobacterium ferrireducens TaxID=2816476 RepID=UPI001A8F8157|nr:ADP-forming succinate--CoA ligase subunit beta [Paradesulfitobacterium ferrireducens]